MGARPDLRLTWSFLSAIAELSSAHHGTYAVADEADDLIPALAQISIKALAAEVRESVSRAELPTFQSRGLGSQALAERCFPPTPFDLEPVYAQRCSTSCDRGPSAIRAAATFVL